MLRVKLAELSNLAELAERKVRNNAMQEVLDIGRPLTGGMHVDPYTHYAASYEAELVEGIQHGLATAERFAEELRLRLHTPALERD